VSGPIANYLAELDHVLAFDRHLSRRVCAEIESHLCDAAEQVGEAAAVLRFGRPAEIARAYAAAGMADRLRRSCIAAAMLVTATLALMWLRTRFLDIAQDSDPLTWLDRGGFMVALGCVAAAWWLAARHRAAPVRQWLCYAVVSLAVSIAASLLRALQDATDHDEVALVAGTALVEVVLLSLLVTQLARLARYMRQLAS
jgi:hypothetical protein